MISHQYKAIFIHIPKCAGSSITAVLAGKPPHERLPGRDHRCLREIEPRLFPSSFIVQKRTNQILKAIRRGRLLKKDQSIRGNVTKSQYQEYFKFTVVRNPWARAVSLYRNVIRSEMHLRNFRLDPHVGFAEFLRLHAGKSMLAPQKYWIIDHQGNVPFDFIARHENIARDWEIIAGKIGLDSAMLQHRLSQGAVDYREYYNDELNHIIETVFRDDIERFDYEF